MFIESIQKEITLNTLTHKVAREYKQALLEWVTVGTNQTGDTPNIDLPITNQIKAEEIQVMWVTGLTREELDTVTEEEYEKILKAVSDHIANKKK